MPDEITFSFGGGGGVWHPQCSGGFIKLNEEAMFSLAVLFVRLNMAIVMWGPVLPLSAFTHALNSKFLLKGG